MDHREVKITGILLAGGKSSRMGKEKGRVKLGNRLLYEYPLQVLEACCDEILISTCSNSVIPAAYPKVCDEILGVGPIGGIYTCLKYSANEVNVILSYDMPGINVPLIDHLLKEISRYNIVVPAKQANQPEPLCGIYRKGALPALEDCIRQKEYAVHKALKKTSSKVIEIEQDLDFWHPELFMNINRIEDLENIPPEIGRRLNED